MRVEGIRDGRPAILTASKNGDGESLDGWGKKIIGESFPREGGQTLDPCAADTLGRAGRGAMVTGEVLSPDLKRAKVLHDERDDIE